MYQTTTEWEHEFGQQMRALRLRQNIDQQRLAEMAGVGVNAVKRLACGKGSTLTSLIKIQRALGREEWLQTLRPPPRSVRCKCCTRKDHGNERQEAAALIMYKSVTVITYSMLKYRYIADTGISGTRRTPS